MSTDQVSKHSFTNLGTISFHLHVGTYVVTDPCYVFPDEMWSDLCDQIFLRDEEESGVIEMDGHKIWWGGTAHGDGTYPVYLNGIFQGNFGVDAGLFAIFPIEFVKKYAPGELDKEGLICVVKIEEGDVRGFTSVGKVLYEKGNLRCGPLKVLTEDEDSNEDDLEED